MEMGQRVNTMLDYRFGWRWLLPYAPGQKLFLGGFDKAEQAFWYGAVVSAKWVQEPKQAVGWIINIDGVSSGELEELIATHLSAVQWVVFAGPGKAVRRLRRRLAFKFSAIREYGLLPATNPRLVIPFHKTRHTLLALALHRPGRWTARLVVWLAAMLARFGVYFPLRHRVLLVASHTPSLQPIGALLAGVSDYLSGEGLDFALYLGTPDDNRKTVVLPLKRVTPAVLIKIGESIQARQALLNEANALAFLGNPSPQASSFSQVAFGRRESNGQSGSVVLTDHLHNHPLAGQVPQMMGLVENGHGVALYQEYRARLKVRSIVLTDAVVDFLAQLSTIDRRSRPLQQVLDKLTFAGYCDLAGGEESSICSIWRWLQRRSEEGAVVHEHRCHGDCAPWNCSWTAQGLFVFDWEESKPQALAFGDAFYFVLAPALHVVGKKNHADLMQKALSLAEQVAKLSGMSRANVRVHFALWLLVKQATHPGYGQFMDYLAEVLEG